MHSFVRAASLAKNEDWRTTRAHTPTHELKLSFVQPTNGRAPELEIIPTDSIRISLLALCVCTRRRL